MKEKPILFSTEMVRAILDGRKTVTRRMVKLKYSNTHLEMRTDKYGARLIEMQNEEPGVTTIKNPDGTTTHTLLFAQVCHPPYRPGDILWVRETWMAVKKYGKVPEYYYRADIDQTPGYKPPDALKWHPSIHMPKEAARIWLRVTDVRVEQLQTEFFKQESTIFELRAEGIDIGETCRECISAYGRPCCNDEDTDDGSECGMLDDVRDDFARLWDGTIKPADRERYGWAANPWVWVIEFERTERPVSGK